MVHTRTHTNLCHSTPRPTGSHTHTCHSTPRPTGSDTHICHSTPHPTGSHTHICHSTPRPTRSPTHTRTHATVHHIIATYCKPHLPGVELERDNRFPEQTAGLVAQATGTEYTIILLYKSSWPIPQEDRLTRQQGWDSTEFIVVDCEGVPRRSPTDSQKLNGVSYTSLGHRPWSQ